MKRTTMSLATIEGKLTRSEMKNIMAGIEHEQNKGCKGILSCMPGMPGNGGCDAEATTCTCKKSGEDYLCL